MKTYVGGGVLFRMTAKIVKHFSTENINFSKKTPKTKKLNPEEAVRAGSPVPLQPFSTWRAEMSSCTAPELLHTHTGAVTVGQSLELWICPLDMLGSHPVP